ncbi:MAG: hypothetical protein VX835_03475 [Pseudomonadota bacterium]|nr:hypothetical protein [Pseudomonadota bacterium]
MFNFSSYPNEKALVNGFYSAYHDPDKNGTDNIHYDNKHAFFVDTYNNLEDRHKSFLYPKCDDNYIHLLKYIKEHRKELDTILYIHYDRQPTSKTLQKVPREGLIDKILKLYEDRSNDREVITGFYSAYHDPNKEMITDNINYEDKQTFFFDKYNNLDDRHMSFMYHKLDDNYIHFLKYIKRHKDNLNLTLTNIQFATNLPAATILPKSPRIDLIDKILEFVENKGTQYASEKIKIFNAPSFQLRCFDTFFIANIYRQLVYLIEKDSSTFSKIDLTKIFNNNNLDIIEKCLDYFDSPVNDHFDKVAAKKAYQKKVLFHDKKNVYQYYRNLKKIECSSNWRDFVTDTSEIDKKIKAGIELLKNVIKDKNKHELDLLMMPLHGLDDIEERLLPTTPEEELKGRYITCQNTNADFFKLLYKIEPDLTINHLIDFFQPKVSELKTDLLDTKIFSTNYIDSASELYYFNRFIATELLDVVNTLACNLSNKNDSYLKFNLLKDRLEEIKSLINDSYLYKKLINNSSNSNFIIEPRDRMKQIPIYFCPDSQRKEFYETLAKTRLDLESNRLDINTLNLSMQCLNSWVQFENEKIDRLKQEYLDFHKDSWMGILFLSSFSTLFVTSFFFLNVASWLILGVGLVGLILANRIILGFSSNETVQIDKVKWLLILNLFALTSPLVIPNLFLIGTIGCLLPHATIKTIIMVIEFSHEKYVNNKTNDLIKKTKLDSIFSVKKDNVIELNSTTKKCESPKLIK